MDRIPEPELMNGPAQALAYARADFAGPNHLFVRLFQEAFPGLSPRTILDLGCGPADITIRLARLFPSAQVHGVDGAANMLRFGKEAISAARLTGRVALFEAVLPQLCLPEAGYAAIVANSLLHHLADPQVLWRTIGRWGAKGAAVLVMDLRRPASREEAAAIVRQYAAAEPFLLREDFFNSLLAAYRPAEVRKQLDQAGLSQLRVAEVSDRHLAVQGCLPG